MSPPPPCTNTLGLKILVIVFLCHCSEKTQDSPSCSFPWFPRFVFPCWSGNKWRGWYCFSISKGRGVGSGGVAGRRSWRKEAVAAETTGRAFGAGQEKAHELPPWCAVSLRPAQLDISFPHNSAVHMRAHTFSQWSRPLKIWAQASDSNPQSFISLRGNRLSCHFKSQEAFIMRNEYSTKNGNKLTLHTFPVS